MMKLLIGIIYLKAVRVEVTSLLRERFRTLKKKTNPKVVPQWINNEPNLSMFVTCSQLILSFEELRKAMKRNMGYEKVTRCFFINGTVL